jgi:hypothetical protein
MADINDQKEALARIRAAAKEQSMDDAAPDPGDKNNPVTKVIVPTEDSLTKDSQGNPKTLEDEDFEPSEEDLAALEELELEDDETLLELEEEITEYPEEWTSLDEVEEDVPEEDE